MYPVAQNYHVLVAVDVVVDEYVTMSEDEVIDVGVLQLIFACKGDERLVFGTCELWNLLAEISAA